MNSLNGLVLVGGKSRRMKKDKALLNYHGKPQYVAIYDLLAKFCSGVFISCRNEQTNLIAENYAKIFDHQDFSDIGPLAGILSAFKKYPENPWLILACDLPFVNEEVLQLLISKRNPSKMAIAFKSAADGLPEPLCAIYEPRGGETLLKFFQQAVFCPRNILINSDIKLLEPFNKTILFNVNSPQEYRETLKALRRKGLKS